MLAVVRESFLSKGFHHHFNLFLKQFPVGVAVKHWGAESFHFAGVVAAADAKDDAPAGQNVGHRKVLGQAQRMPHRGNVEAAAILQPLRVAGQVQPQHYQVGDAFVAFGLEVMLRHPEFVVAVGFQMAGDVQRPVKDAGQLVIGIPAVVGGGAVQPQVVVHDMAGVRCAEALEHSRLSFSFRFACTCGGVWRRLAVRRGAVGPAPDCTAQCRWWPGTPPPVRPPTSGCPCGWF